LRHSSFNAFFKKIKNGCWKFLKNYHFLVEVATTKMNKFGKISSQLLPPGASIGRRYVLQLLFCKNHKNVNISVTTSARE
jgi:hypothetical protein